MQFVFLNGFPKIALQPMLSHVKPLNTASVYIRSYLTSYLRGEHIYTLSTLSSAYHAKVNSLTRLEGMPLYNEH